MRWVAIFDLDGTLTWHDSLMPFLRGYLGRHPGRLLRLWRLPIALLVYAATGRDRGLLKSRIIRMVMGGDTRAAIDTWADAFVAAMPARGAFRTGALAALQEHARAGDLLVLLSASPDLYVPRVGRLLHFDHVVCTEVAWRGDRLDGRLKTENRRGEEKSRCIERLRAEHPDMPVVAYGNSASDIAHMSLVDRALLVNGTTAARRQATAAGIPTANWT